MFIVFDIDDTLGDTAHRRHFIIPPGETYADYSVGAPGDAFKPDWDGFFEARVNDAPITPAIRVLNAFVAVGYRVELWTAAREDFRELTREWLARHDVNPDLLTHMRPKGNFAKTTLLKESWIMQDKPDMLFDDHEGICDMARRHGVYACAVGRHNY